MIIVNYKSKEHLQSNIGQCLAYQETNVKRKCYTSDGDIVVTNRPSVTGNKNLPEFWAVVTMKEGKIYKVK